MPPNQRSYAAKRVACRRELGNPMRGHGIIAFVAGPTAIGTPNQTSIPKVSVLRRRLGNKRDHHALITRFAHIYACSRDCRWDNHLIRNAVRN